MFELYRTFQKYLADNLYPYWNIPKTRAYLKEMFEFQIICDVFVAFLLSRMRSARTYSVRKNTGFKILMVLHVLRTSENENIVFVMPPSSMCLYPRIYNAWIVGRISFVLGVYRFFIIGRRPMTRIIQAPERGIFTEDLLLK